jgi:hypothetical protein
MPLFSRDTLEIGARFRQALALGQFLALRVDEPDIFRDEPCFAVLPGQDPEPEHQWQRADGTNSVLLAHGAGLEKSLPKPGALHAALYRDRFGMAARTVNIHQVTAA